MPYQQYQSCIAIAASRLLAPYVGLMRFPAPVTGSIVNVTVISKGGSNALGDSVFDCKINGVTMFAVVGDRPKILAGATVGGSGYARGTQATALCNSTDEITIDLVSVPAGGIGGPLWMMILIDGSVTSLSFTKQLYVGALVRNPTGPELAAGVAALDAAMTTSAAFRTAIDTLCQSILNGAEYIARGRSNSQFIDDCYAGVLGRSADPAGHAANLAYLNVPNTRSATIAVFTQSTECLNNRGVEMWPGLAPLSDSSLLGGYPVDLAALADTKTLIFDGPNNKWVAGTGGGGALAGDVTGAAGVNTVEKIRNRAIVAMPAPLTLADNFNDNAIDPAMWAAPVKDGGGANPDLREANARFEFWATSGGGGTCDYHVDNLVRGDFRGKTIIFYAGGGWSGGNGNLYEVHVADYVTRNSFGMKFGQSDVSTAQQTTGQTTYAATGAAMSGGGQLFSGWPFWIRYRIIGTDILFDTSPDSVTWTNRWTCPMPFVPSDSFLCLITRSVDAAGMVFDALSSDIVGTDPVTEKQTLAWDVTNSRFSLETMMVGRRDTVAASTASIADAAEATGTISLGMSFSLIRVTSNVAARLRLYSSAAARTADAARAIGTDPTGEHGVILDINMLAGNLTYDIPAIVGANLESTPSAAIPYAFQNKSGGASVVTATITRLLMEP